MRGRFVTLPNVITLTRVPLGLAAVVCLASGATLAAMILLGAAFLSDAVDGTVARLTNSTSAWGRILDPLADKVVLAAVAVGLLVMGRIAPVFLAVLVVRDVAVGFGGIWHIRRFKRIPAPNIPGKASTVIVALYLLRQAFWPATERLWLGMDPLGLTAAAVLLGSGLIYAPKLMRDQGSTR